VHAVCRRVRVAFSCANIDDCCGSLLALVVLGFLQSVTVFGGAAKSVCVRLCASSCAAVSNKCSFPMCVWRWCAHMNTGLKHRFVVKVHATSRFPCRYCRMSESDWQGQGRASVSALPRVSGTAQIGAAADRFKLRRTAARQVRARADSRAFVTASILRTRCFV
jgi:hypothetical protein